MAKTMLPSCKECQYCIQRGRMQTQRGRLGRKKYFCTHPDAPTWMFIGFGDMSVESPLALKTRKKWCPMEERKDG